jgi:hypothetical protein
MRWWKHHENKLPKFGDEGEMIMRDIQDFTWRIPLHFSSSDSKTFEQWKTTFFHGSCVDTLFNCLTRGDAPSNRSESFDYRYFYHDGKSGECACRAAAAVIEMENQQILRTKMYRLPPHIQGQPFYSRISD